MNIFTADEKKLKIEWETVPGASSYDVLRAGSRLGAYTLLETVTETCYTDNSPNKNRYENYYKITAKNAAGEISVQLVSLELKIFGESIKFYDAKYDSIEEIGKEINSIHDTEMFGGVTDPDGRRAEFSKKRYALYFKPGEYRGFEKFKIGFYTHAAGLGAVPAQTKLHGSVETPPHQPNNNVTCNFWRSIENLEIDSGQFLWAVSQAAPIRRMKVNVPSEFDWKGGWSSGGFTADCIFNASAGSRSQQQWYARNSHFAEGFSGVNWNKVIQGSTGKIEDDNWESGGCSSKIDTSPVIREKPFLFIENGEYKVFVPALRREAAGISWTDTGMGEGRTLDLVKEFYIAKAGADSSESINRALAEGRHIFFTPGRYELSAPLHVKKAGTVLMGTGYATLIPGPENNWGAVFIDDVDDVTVCGLMFDALYSSAYLLCAGGTGSDKNHAHAPVLLSDIFLRIGGYREENVNVDAAVIINSSNVIGDHFWVWRADHGQGVGWERNTSKNGLIVKGSDVIFYGLFVEHFHEYQTLWMGENGRMYFYQCETPYDPVNQNAYKSHSGTVNGWAAYKVANSVERHFAEGLGIYAVFTRTGPDRKKSESVLIENAIEVPNKSGVTIKHACIINLSLEDGPKSGICSIVNGTGPSATAGVKREYLAAYTDSGTPPGDETFIIPGNLLP